MTLIDPSLINEDLIIEIKKRAAKSYSSLKKHHRVNQHTRRAERFLVEILELCDEVLIDEDDMDNEGGEE